MFTANQELSDVVGTALVAYLKTALFSVIQEPSDVVDNPLMPYIMKVCVVSYTKAV